MALARIMPRPPTVFVTLNYNDSLGGQSSDVVTFHGPSHREARDITILPASWRRPKTPTFSGTKLRRDMKELDVQMHVRMIHEKFDRLPFERRIFWCAVTENVPANPHVHMACWLPRGMWWKFRTLWGSSGSFDLWRDLTGSGSSAVRPVDDHFAWANYVSKERPLLAEDSWRFILASEFWPSWCRPPAP